MWDGNLAGVAAWAPLAKLKLKAENLSMPEVQIERDFKDPKSLCDFTCECHSCPTTAPILLSSYS